MHCAVMGHTQSGKSTTLRSIFGQAVTLGVNPIMFNPVKSYEALATGKPLVAVALPELQPYAGPVLVARDDDEFLAGIAAGLAESDPALIEERRKIAQNNTWDIRYRVIKNKVLAEQSSPLGQVEAFEPT